MKNHEQDAAGIDIGSIVEGCLQHASKTCVSVDQNDLLHDVTQGKPVDSVLNKFRCVS